MINFLKKQFIKILIYGFILLFAIYFINYFNLSATNISIIITTINSIFIIFIGKSWIEDYKIENSKELETHKSKLSNYTLVTKLQFELEFKIYKEIYSNLYNLYIKTDNLTIPLDLSPKKEKKKRLDVFYPIYNKVSLNITENRPFYSEEIYNCVIETRNLCFEECQELEISLIKPNPIAYFDNWESDSRKKKIKENLDKISILIRKRIVNMKIIDD